MVLELSAGRHEAFFLLDFTFTLPAGINDERGLEHAFERLSVEKLATHSIRPCWQLVHCQGVVEAWQG